MSAGRVAATLVSAALKVAYTLLALLDQDENDDDDYDDNDDSCDHATDDCACIHGLRDFVYYRGWWSNCSRKKGIKYMK
jgi:hypothetical protein